MFVAYYECEFSLTFIIVLDFPVVFCFLIFHILCQKSYWHNHTPVPTFTELRLFLFVFSTCFIISMLSRYNIFIVIIFCTFMLRTFFQINSFGGKHVHDLLFRLLAWLVSSSVLIGTHGLALFDFF